MASAWLVHLSLHCVFMSVINYSGPATSTSSASPGTRRQRLQFVAICKWTSPLFVEWRSAHFISLRRSETWTRTLSSYAIEEGGRNSNSNSVLHEECHNTTTYKFTVLAISWIPIVYIKIQYLSVINSTISKLLRLKNRSQSEIKALYYRWQLLTFYVKSHT